MFRIVFKNLEKSELIKDVVSMRLEQALEKFPKSRPRSVSVTLEMQNSPTQKGPEAFKVKLEIVGGKYHGVILEKSSSDVYVAIAAVVDSLLERLNRHSDRVRTKALKERRRSASQRRTASVSTQRG